MVCVTCFPVDYWREVLHVNLLLWFRSSLELDVWDCEEKYSNDNHGNLVQPEIPDRLVGNPLARHVCITAVTESEATNRNRVCEDLKSIGNYWTIPKILLQVLRFPCSIHVQNSYYDIPYFSDVSPTPMSGHHFTTHLKSL